MLRRFVIGLALALAGSAALAAVEIAGVRFAEGVEVAGSRLALNAAGALYLPRTSGDAAVIADMSGRKRVTMHILYDEIDRESLVDA